MSHFIHVIVEGNIYSCYRRFEDDSAFLLSLCKILADVPLCSVFNVLYHSISSRWYSQHDVPYPFGDHRECLVSSSWVIDLDNDILTLRKKDARNYRIRMHKLLRKISPSVTDMKMSKPMPLPRFTLDGDFGSPTWEPVLSAPPRQVAFIGKILEDFVYQWRHVFRSQYNEMTFRKLACAIIRIATLDFSVKEITRSRAGTGRVVWVASMPPWKPISDHVICYDRVSIILCQHFAHAMTLIRDDYGKRRQRHESTNPSNAPCLNITYLLLSIREIFLYKICTCGDHDAVYTKPERLFNGVENASEQALAYLLTATQMPSDSLGSPLRAIPVEIQDTILDNLSLGRVEGAKIGCLLSLGTPFRWKTIDGTIQRQEVLTTRVGSHPVESQIWFDDYLSGLVYK